MTTAPTGPRVDALARTYGPEAPTRVQEYRRVQACVAENPGLGSGAISSKLGVPRSRIRAWVDADAKPDALRAIETAHDHGWFDAGPGSDVFEALVRCHAWIFAGGSIAADTYRPTFCIDGDEPEAQLRADLDTLGLSYRKYRASEREHGTELCPSTDGVVFGRFLAGVMGAPVGSKNEASPFRIPYWLQRAATSIQRCWIRTYVSVRGVVRDDRNDEVQLCEQRSPEYRKTLRDVLRSVVQTPEAVQCYGDSSVHVSQPAARQLRM
jgi:hypothetical protein